MISRALPVTKRCWLSCESWTTRGLHEREEPESWTQARTVGSGPTVAGAETMSEERSRVLAARWSSEDRLRPS